MTVIIGVGVFLFFSFAVIVLRGAPYVPTHKSAIAAGLDLLNLRPEDLVIEPGCGDGRVLIEVAKRGAYAVGYELNPILYVVSLVRTRKYRNLVRVEFGDMWLKEWPEATALFMFQTRLHLKPLKDKVHKSGITRLVSYGYELDFGKKIGSTLGAHLYRV